jgi:hypothetical protein
MRSALQAGILLILVIALHKPLKGQNGGGLTGIVKSTSGQPLVGVRIYCRADMETTTNEKGQFRLYDRGRVIFLQHNGYRPVVLVSEGLKNEIEIVMEEAKQTEWLIPPCGQELGGRQLRIARLRLQHPSGAQVKKGRDIDYEDFSIAYGQGNDQQYLYAIWGPMASHGFPPDSWISASVGFTSRSWRFGEAVGMDVRGRSKEGKFWRYFGTYGIGLSYKEASKEAADYFDRIMDSACHQ